tara:strand:- start:904 stop:1101 length:198 start_codon:yes stop_codon:yes gene_type:complete
MSIARTGLGKNFLGGWLINGIALGRTISKKTIPHQTAILTAHAEGIFVKAKWAIPPEVSSRGNAH